MGLVFQRVVNGVPLRFHLAGINNQNFLMRDEQTGTYWQQITGLAVSGTARRQASPDCFRRRAYVCTLEQRAARWFGA